MAYRTWRVLLGLGKPPCRIAGAAAQRGLTQGNPASAAVSCQSAQHALDAAAAELQPVPVRHFLPLSTTVALQQLPAGDAAAVPAAAAACVSITVLGSAPGSRQTHILVNCGSPAATSPALAASSHSSAAAAAALSARLGGPAAATAAGAWPALVPTWLFGFVCGSAAASAMAYSCLLPPGAGPGAGLGGGAAGTGGAGAANGFGSGPHGGFAVAGLMGDHMQPDSSISKNGSDVSVVAEVLTRLSFPSSSSSDSSGGSSARSSSNSGGGVWSYLQRLGRFAAPAAQAATLPAAQQQGRQLLPTPWETSASSSSSDWPAATAATAAAATAAGPSGSSDAVLMRSSISRAAAAAAPAVVHIAGMADSRAQGSGFIYDPSGFILTNAHVVLGLTGTPHAPLRHTTQQQQQQQPDNRQQLLLQRAFANGNGSSGSDSSGSSGSVMVHLQDGRVFEGRVVAADRLSDLAVVAIDAPEQLPAATLGNSNSLRVGEWVLALGSPFLLKQTVTAGIVSCVERRGAELGLHRLAADFIQTDCAINLGNSGGPLVDLDGAVVGMASMKASGGDGVSFAIPINSIKQLLLEISRHGRVRRPYAGIAMSEVGATRLAQLRSSSCPDFPQDVTSGIVVTRVAPRSPAESAGLQEDDVIVGIGPRRVGGGGGGEGVTAAALADALKGAIGGSIELLVVREQQQQHGVQQQRAAGAAAGSSSGSGSRYAFVSVTLRPVEAPAS